MNSLTCSTIDSDWPQEEPEYHPEPHELDDDELPWEIDADYWDVLLPDDDYEPMPEYGDFWADEDEL